MAAPLAGAPAARRAGPALRGPAVRAGGGAARRRGGGRGAGRAEAARHRAQPGLGGARARGGAGRRGVGPARERREFRAFVHRWLDGLYAAGPPLTGRRRPGIIQRLLDYCAEEDGDGRTAQGGGGRRRAAGLATLKALADAGVPAVCFEAADPPRRPVGVRGDRLARVPHPAPEHQPGPDRVRRPPDAGALARLPRPRPHRRLPRRLRRPVRSARRGAGAAHRRPGRPRRRRPLDGPRHRTRRPGRRHRRGGDRRQRPQPGAQAARPPLPGQLRGGAAAQPRLPGPRTARRPAGARRRRRQLRHGHRRRRLVRGRRVPCCRCAAASGWCRSTCSADRRTPSTARWPAGCPGGCGSGSARRCSPLTVGDPARYGLPRPAHGFLQDHPDPVRRPALPAHPRRHRGPPRHRPRSTGSGSSSPTAAPTTSTWSSGAPATGW